MFLEEKIVNKGRELAKGLTADTVNDAIVEFMTFVYDEMVAQQTECTCDAEFLTELKRLNRTWKSAWKRLNDENNAFVVENAFEIMLEHFNPKIYPFIVEKGVFA